MQVEPCLLSGPYKSLSAGFPRQQPVKLSDDQLNDLHAAMRVGTEDVMEAEISNFIFRKPPSDNPLERIQQLQTNEEFNYQTRSVSSQQYAIRSISGDQAKPYLSDVLVNAQAGGVTHRDIDENTGIETITTDPPLRDQYMAIVNKDLNDQYIAAKDFELQSQLGSAMAYRENQVNAEYDSVIDEIQGDINAEKIDLDTDGQLISERFGWVSGSEAMAKGEYGQTNGGIRGITDSTVNAVGAGGGAEGGDGECCIFNQYGGGGCGPCR